MMVLRILAFIVCLVIFTVGCAALNISPVICVILFYALSAIFFDHIDR